MPHKVECVPAQCFEYAENFGEIIPYLVAGVCRTARALAMTGEIHSDHVKIGQQRCQLRKAGGIIQPPVKREQGPATWVAPRQARQLKPIYTPFQWDCRTKSGTIRH